VLSSESGQERPQGAAAREARFGHFIKHKEGKIAERNTGGHEPRHIPG